MHREKGPLPTVRPTVALTPEVGRTAQPPLSHRASLWAMLGPAQQDNPGQSSCCVPFSLGLRSLAVLRPKEVCVQVLAEPVV